jgi:hypothetical protein
MLKFDSIPILRRVRPRHFQRLRIAIVRDHRARFRQPRRNGPRMPAHPGRAIQIRSVRPDIQKLQRLREQDRIMLRHRSSRKRTISRPPRGVLFVLRIGRLGIELPPWHRRTRLRQNPDPIPVVGLDMQFLAIQPQFARRSSEFMLTRPCCPLRTPPKPRRVFRRARTRGGFSFSAKKLFHFQTPGRNGDRSQLYSGRGSHKHLPLRQGLEKWR